MPLFRMHRPAVATIASDVFINMFVDAGVLVPFSPWLLMQEPGTFWITIEDFPKARSGAFELTVACSDVPTPSPTSSPTWRPTPVPTRVPTPWPSGRPSPEPTPRPTRKPLPQPTPVPTPGPSAEPTQVTAKALIYTYNWEP
jgi:hypothetical protein